MLDRGATEFWEVYDYDMPPGKIPKKLWSLCHGWSSGPGFLLPTYVLGVEPTAPGWKRVRVRPALGDLDHAEGVVPTPMGPITVELQDYSTKLPPQPQR